jgi:hypothetical protein
LESLSPSIVAAGGKPLIITAEPEVHLKATRDSTGYTGDAIVDTENILVEDFKKRSWVDIAITSQKGYEHGMAQPAVLAVTRDGTVLESWAIVPSMVSCLDQRPLTLVKL